MYHFYHTPGFVLSAQDISEGSRMLSLFTRELGLVRVHARSIREQRSKLRGFLQPLSFAQVALVRGRELWRLTTAGPANTFFSQDSLVGTRESCGGTLAWAKRLALARVASTLERQLQGEEQDSALYDCFHDGLNYLPQCSDEKLLVWETLLSARLLSRLGYGHLESITPQLASDEWSDESFTTASKYESALSSLISNALSASQL